MEAARCRLKLQRASASCAAPRAPKASRQRTLRFAGGVGARGGGFAAGVEVVRGRRSECGHPVGLGR
eukprot:735540-Prymnesium_polylepis.1